MGSSDTHGLFPGQDGAVLTWDGVHAFLLQLWEVLQEELEGVICGDALEFEPVHVGLWGQVGLMPDTLTPAVLPSPLCAPPHWETHSSPCSLQGLPSPLHSQGYSPTFPAAAASTRLGFAFILFPYSHSCFPPLLPLPSHPLSLSFPVSCWPWPPAMTFWMTLQLTPTWRKASNLLWLPTR